MKKKNGFTLIELLVAIAIMLSVLGIAIVSFINVSDRKKEESWETVKDQVELAAEEFFTYNEYLFEGLSDGATAEISVGKLVQEDYLNKVTNPITGKAVSECMIVNVTKSNGTYKLEVDDTSKNSDVETCETGSSLTIKEVGAPEISVEKKCGSKGDNGWCKRSSDGKGVNVTADAPEAVNIQHAVSVYKTGVWDPSGEIKLGKTYEDNENTNGKSVCFLATGSNGAKSSSCVDYKIDMDLPSGTLSITSNENKYKSNVVNVNLTAFDELSKLSKIEYRDRKGTPDLIKSGAEDWEYKTSWEYLLKDRKLFSSLKTESRSDTPSLVIIDGAGNETKIDSSYSTYVLCSETSSDGFEKGKVTCDTSKQKYTWSETEKYKDKYVSDVVCPSGTPIAKEGESCQTLSCPDVNVVGAVTGKNGWYKKGTAIVSECSEPGNVLTDSGCQPSGVKVTPKEGTEHWSWATDQNGKLHLWTTNNVGEIIKNLSQGKTTGIRQYKIVVYDKYGNSYGENGECSGTFKIDTEPPTVDLIKAAANYWKITAGNKNNSLISVYAPTDKQIVTVQRVEGFTFHCLNKGDKHKRTDDKSDNKEYECTVGSKYTVSDNFTNEDDLILKLDSIKLTNDNYQCYDANYLDDGTWRCGPSRPYPFPNRFELTAEDEAGNVGKDTLKYLLKYNGYNTYEGWNTSDVWSEAEVWNRR